MICATDTSPVTILSTLDNDRLELDDNEAAYELLSDQVEAFVNAWETGGEAPALARFLPERPPALRRLAIIELIKVDMEYRGQRGCLRSLEEYFAEFSEVRAAGVPLDLVYEDYHVRRQSGETVDPRAYLEQFPQHAARLEKLLHINEPYYKTTVCVKGPPMMAEVGQRLDDFELLAKLGEGAFAKVFLARQVHMQRLVALKVSTDESNEPQTLAKLDHPHIVRVYDERVLIDLKMRLLYMQYLAGGTLEEAAEAAHDLPPEARSGQVVLAAIDRKLAERGEEPPEDSVARRTLATLTWPETVCWIGARLASALDYAHRSGTLHRDIKPANVLLSAEGIPKLADFNISFSSKVEGASARDFFGGSLAYMSPEQLEAYHPDHPREPEDLDGRSDLYSLGVVLWEMLAGRRPFADEMLPAGMTATVADMIQRRRNGVAEEEIALLPSDTPAGVRETLLRALQPQAEHRYQTAGQLARQLELCLEPELQALLQPPPQSWQDKLFRRPFTGMLIGGLIPNVVLSVLNIWFNYEAVVAIHEQFRALFLSRQLGVVNSIAYTVGIVAGYLVFRPVLLALWEKRRNPRQPQFDWPHVSRRCLTVGDWFFWIVFLLWFVSSFVFPTWTYLATDMGSAEARNLLLHFSVSQLLSGAIVAAITFFVVTLLTVRGIYPRLIPADLEDEDLLQQKSAELVRLSRRTWLYFIALAVAPLAAVAFLGIKVDPRLYWWFVMLSLIGALAFAISLWLIRGIQNDLETLLIAMQPVSPDRERRTHVAGLLGSQKRTSSSLRPKIAGSTKRVR
jgi:serine/threonine protein kinase